MGYRLDVNGKRIVYAPDNELSFIRQSIDDRKDEFDEEEKELLEAMKEEERCKSIAFMRDVDVLIHDAQYTEADYQRKRGWGHSCYTDTVQSAVDADARSLYLFSHDPNNDDDTLGVVENSAQKIASEQSPDMHCFCARKALHRLGQLVAHRTALVNRLAIQADLFRHDASAEAPSPARTWLHVRDALLTQGFLGARLYRISLSELVNPLSAIPKFAEHLEGMLAQLWWGCVSC